MDPSSARQKRSNYADLVYRFCSPAFAGSDRLGINADRSSEPNIALDMPAWRHRHGAGIRKPSQKRSFPQIGSRPKGNVPSDAATYLWRFRRRVCRSEPGPNRQRCRWLGFCGARQTGGETIVTPNRFDEGGLKSLSVHGERTESIFLRSDNRK